LKEKFDFVRRKFNNINTNILISSLTGHY
jgi:hypothetical protein